jgi:hypothetical protein
MDLIEVKLTDDETINFQVYVFDEGEYIRVSGNSANDPAMKGDSIWFWPDEAKQSFAAADGSSGNPAGFHFKFTPKVKLPTKGLQSLEAARKKAKGKTDGVAKDVTGKIGKSGAVNDESDEDEDEDEDEVG